MAGIFGPKQPANADIQALINSVQNAVIERCELEKGLQITFT